MAALGTKAAARLCRQALKQGPLHVAPPSAVIKNMLTLRIHLDDVPADNAPLLVAPGSHRLGLVAERDAAATVARCGRATCLTAAGDVWAYATPILHASTASVGAAHRRVLQVDYAAADLPGGLAWLGI
jgi:ectoine hydroxylase-related dioxygenase (phytanoyl-CoA dioxygenase family)